MAVHTILAILDVLIKVHKREWRYSVLDQQICWNESLPENGKIS